MLRSMSEKLEKTALRKNLRQVLSACSPQVKAKRDERLTNQLLQLPQLIESRTVLIYYGIGIEPDTRQLTEKLWALGKTVAFPVCLPQRQMEARAVSSWEELIPGKFGIPQPGDACPIIKKADIDLILVPALACDRQGYRLGQGAGYYDRYLSDYRGVTVALCGKDAMLPRVPREEHDKAVSILVTDE